MRVKVGYHWYEPLKGQPIMVELTPEDKRLIHGMPIDANKYALFADDDSTTIEEKREWMNK